MRSIAKQQVLSLYGAYSPKISESTKLPIKKLKMALMPIGK